MANPWMDGGEDTKPEAPAKADKKAIVIISVCLLAFAVIAFIVNH